MADTATPSPISRQTNGSFTVPQHANTSMNGGGVNGGGVNGGLHSTPTQSGRSGVLTTNHGMPHSRSGGITPIQTGKSEGMSHSHSGITPTTGAELLKECIEWVENRRVS